MDASGYNAETFGHNSGRVGRPSPSEGMTRQEDAKDQVTCLYYDELNRLRGKDYFTNSANCPSDPGIGNYDVSYGYDADTYGKGRRTSMGVSGGDYTSWVYDARGRVESESKQIPGGGQFITAFTYNLADLPETMTYPGTNGELVDFDYNNRMLPIYVSGTDTYAQSIAYDSASRMKEIVRGLNKIHTDYNYNPWNADGGRLLNITSTQVSTSNTLQNLTYDYDSVGNINTITDATNSGQKQCFQYDDLDRLIKSTTYEDSPQGCSTQTGFGNYSEEYDYDTTTGNLSEKNLITYTYSSGHAHAVSSLSNGNSYVYDANGNMTSRSVNGQNYELGYDTENRLVSVTGVNGTSLTASFYYDADGKRVKSVVEGETIYFVGSHYEKTGTDVVTKYYMAGTTRLAVRTGNTLKYLLGDHLGSSSVATDDAGGLDVRTLYKAWGEVRFTTADKTLPTRYTFTGQYSYVSDDATDHGAAGFGLMFYNARWYDPALGRFAQADTIVPGGVQGLDRFNYVNNNPINFTDPSGHCADALSAQVCIYLLPTGPIGWVIIGILVVVDIVLIYIAVEQTTQMKGEYVPQGLTKGQRDIYGDAVHEYKDEWGIPPGVDVPKEILDAIAAAVAAGASAAEAVDSVDGPPEDDESLEEDTNNLEQDMSYG